MDTPRAITIERFRSQKNRSLLAYMAHHRRLHSRELLLDLLWPEADPRDGRNGLRVALSNLRTILEPSGIPKGTVIEANRQQAGLVGRAFVTDVEEFEKLVQLAGAAAGPEEKLDALSRAATLYTGPFLAGFYENWITAEASRLEDAYYLVLKQLVAGLHAAGDLPGAREWTLRGAAIDPLRESLQQDLLRFCAPGEEAKTLKRYEVWRTQMRKAGEEPLALTQLLADELKSRSAPAGANLAKTAQPPRSRESGHGENPPESDPPRGAMVAASYPVDSRSRAGVVRPPLLPPTWTNFFGRQTEIKDLVAMLDNAAIRIVTLTGPGGCGKTRLAMEVASNPGPVSPGRPLQLAAFVSLAEVRSANMVLPALLDAMGEPAGSPDSGTIAEVLQERYAGARCLIVFDNFEHLREDALPLLHDLLSRVPHLVCLLTSRHRLNFPGERDFRLDTLPVPANNSPDLAESASFPSVRLFMDRARLARPDLPMTRVNVESAARLCARLDGLPLAIELAAARVALFSPAQILAELEGGAGHNSGTHPNAHLDWQSSDSTAPTRHQSLRAAITWSVRQLAPAVAQFWSKLWVFRDGWTFEDATAICEEENAGTMMLALRDASLLSLDTHDFSGGAPRGHMLEALREFAGERLTPADQEDLSQRHAWRYLQLAETAMPHINGPEGSDWLDRVEAESQNLRRALEWFLSHDTRAALRLVATLWWVWEMKGRAHEGRSWLSQAISKAQPIADAMEGNMALATGDERELLLLLARSLNGAGKLANLEADFQASDRHLSQALALFHGLGDVAGEADTLYSMGFMKLRSGDMAAARELCTRSVVLHRDIGDQRTLSDALYNLSMVDLFEGDFAAVRATHAERLALHLNAGYKRGMAVSLEGMGMAALFEGDAAAAAAYFGESLSIFQKSGELTSVARVLWGLGHVARGNGDGAAARTYFERALKLARDTRYSWAMPYLLEALAMVSLEEGDFPTAVKLLAGAQSLRESHREPLPAPIFQAEFNRATELLEQQLGSGVYQAHWIVGRSLSTGEAIALAMRENLDADEARNLPDRH